MQSRYVEQPRVLSRIPGRVRLHLPAWPGGDWERVKAHLGQVPGVECVRANPLTGNVLVHFDPQALSAEDLRRALARLEAPSPCAGAAPTAGLRPPSLAKRGARPGRTCSGRYAAVRGGVRGALWSSPGGPGEAAPGLRSVRLGLHPRALLEEPACSDSLAASAAGPYHRQGGKARQQDGGDPDACNEGRRRSRTGRSTCSILGGGITGAGVALDAALRGLRVALIDKGDFASRHQQRLLQAGPRRPALPGTRRLPPRLRGAARARPAAAQRPAPRPAAALRAALLRRGRACRRGSGGPACSLYDLLAGRGNIRRSRPLPLAQLGAASSPACAARGLPAGPSIFDAQMDDARLCMEVLRTAATHGATRGQLRRGGRRSSRQAGQCHGGAGASTASAARELRIAARQVLNATGPWGDAVRRLAGDEGGPAAAADQGRPPDRARPRPARRVPAAAPRRRPRLLRHPLAGQDADRHHRHRLRRAARTT